MLVSSSGVQTYLTHQKHHIAYTVSLHISPTLPSDLSLHPWQEKTIPHELTHRVKAAKEEHGVRIVPPAWILLLVQLVHCPKPRLRKSSCAIRNKRDKMLDLFPDGAGDRLTFQSVEIRRLDFQSFSAADWLNSPLDFRDRSKLCCYWSKSLTWQVHRDPPQSSSSSCSLPPESKAGI